MIVNRISVLIPTYERHHSLLRVLKYWSSQQVDIVVVDGSADPFPSINDCNFNSNIRYFCLPVPIEKRLDFALKHINTDFVSLISDDEILLCSALNKAADFLCNDLSYSAVLGTTVAFRHSRKGLSFRGEYLSASNLRINSDDPAYRLIQRARVKGNSIYYSLTRAEVMKTAIEFIGSHTYSCPYIGEYQMEAILLGAGKVKVIEDLMWLRNRDGGCVNLPSFDRSVLFSDWMIDPKNADQLSILKNSFEVYFGKVSPSKHVSGEFFVNLFSDFERDSASRQPPKNLLIRLIRYVARHFSEFVLDLMCLGGTSNLSKWFPSDMIYRVLLKEGIAFDTVDAKKAIESLPIPSVEQLHSASLRSRLAIRISRIWRNHMA